MTLGAWIAARGVALWQVEDLTAPVRAAIGFAAAAAAVPLVRPAPAKALEPRVSGSGGAVPSAHLGVIPGSRVATLAPAPATPDSPVAAGEAQTAAAAQPLMPSPRLPPPLVPTPLARGASRLAGSVWLIARGGANRALLGGQLGASQAGARLTYALDRKRHLALAARVATPLAGKGREAAIGLDWQPTGAALHLVAEQRFALDGGHGGPTLGIIGGFGPRRLIRGIDVEGYGQAGVIARDGGEAFADGAVRASHPVAAVGAVRIDIGAGAWGGAQRGAARLDIGPSLGLRVPIGARAIRLSADWRQRVAGDARPGSGPALSIGSDF